MTRARNKFCLFVVALALLYPPIDAAAQSWSDTFAPYSFNGSVDVAVEYGNELYVLGGFSFNGRHLMRSVVRWDGTAYQSTGDGLPYDFPVSAAVYQGDLYVGYFFGGIKRYDGNSWELVLELDGGFSDAPYLTVYDGKLVAVGEFRFLSTYEWLGHSIAYDGVTWDSLGTLDNVSPGQIDLREYNGELYVIGAIQGPGINNLARWDGTSWQPVVGYGNVGLSAGIQGSGYALAEYNGKLVIAGNITQVGDLPVNGIGTFDAVDSTWGTLGNGFDGPVRTLAIYGGNLIASGDFLNVGVIPARRFAQWDGANWSELGGGGDSWARDFLEFGGNLVTVGAFDELDGVRVPRTVLWNGSTWTPQQGETGLGVEGDINEMIAYDGKLIVAGDVPAAGPTLVRNLAAWDGSQWSEFGGGANGAITTGIIDGNELIIGGDFTGIGGVNAQRIARWNGTTWVKYGAGLASAPTAIAVYGGQVYAGSSDLRRWNGAFWGVVTPNPTAPQVYAMAVYNGDLVVGGLGYLSRWNGTTWNDIATEPIFYQALFDWNGTLFIGTEGSSGPSPTGILTWDGATLSDFMPTIPSPAFGDRARDFCEHDGRLVAGFEYWAMRIGSGDPAWDPLVSGFTSSGQNVTQIASYGGHIMVGDRITYMFDGTASLGMSQLDEVVSAVEDLPFDGGYRLDQNVPNPFNPMTSIRYTLARPGHVRMDVFDVAGRHLVTLIDAYRAAGPHAVALDMEDAGVVASGIYFYRLKTPGFTQTRKMLLLK